MQTSIKLDATRRFPLPDNSFDYVFSEHMIEHINYGNGLRMLSECHRVLKPGGRVRIATPDLQFVVDLYGEKKSPLMLDFLRYSKKMYLPPEEGEEDVFIINNFVRNWGHQFIYDEKSLRRSLERAGFTEVVRCNICESADTALSGLECINRMPPGLLELCTIVMEAIKPRS